MSDVQNTQTAVTDTNTPPPAENAATGDAQALDFDALLGQYDQAQTKKPEASQPDQAPSTAPDLGRQALERVARMEFERDIEPVLKTIRGDVPESVFDKAELQEWIDGHARRNPKVAEAWVNRTSDPKEWAKYERALTQKFAVKWKPTVDAAATEDREAVTAAVRGSSTRAPEEKPPDYTRMSNAEFRETVKKKYGFEPGV